MTEAARSYIKSDSRSTSTLLKATRVSAQILTPKACSLHANILFLSSVGVKALHWGPSPHCISIQSFEGAWRRKVLPPAQDINDVFVQRLKNVVSGTLMK